VEQLNSASKLRLGQSLDLFPVDRMIERTKYNSEETSCR
jgi:hypothetical protein